MADNVHREKLNQWKAEYIRTQGKEPTGKEIFADPIAQALFTAAREFEKSQAAPPKEGGCCFYIYRRRRYCTSRAKVQIRTPGVDEYDLKYCSDHVAMAKARDAGETTSDNVVAAKDNNTATDQHNNTAAATGNNIAAATDNNIATDQHSNTVTAENKRPCPPAEQPDSRLHKKQNMKRCLKRMSNPMSKQHIENIIDQPEWDDNFADPSRPVLLDIGCAKGRFLQQLATQFADAGHPAGDGNPVAEQQHNFVGIELFAPLVQAANEWREVNNPQRNLFYIAGNASHVLKKIVIPKLQRVTIQFPDPWADKHKKRRLVTEGFAAQLFDLLPKGGELYVATDWYDMAVDISNKLVGQGFVVSPRCNIKSAQVVAAGKEVSEVVDTETMNILKRSSVKSSESVLDAASEDVGGGPEGKWLENFVYGAPTERDIVCEKSWRCVWRRLFVKP